jgi:hypothetical protein
MITAAPKISIINAKTQKKNAGIIDCGSRIADRGLRIERPIV